jgi:molecular chaperone HscB
MMTDTPTTSAPAACWACSVVFAGSPLLCPSCGKVQPASSYDYFQVFNLERLLSLDAAALTSEFHRLSRKLHPDRFARASAVEQQSSLANTALLNDAYRTLRDSLTRTEYLLKLEGLKIGEENSGKGKSADRQPPADLLEEVFELNMQLEEMRMNQNMGEADEALHADLTAAKARFETLLADVDSDLAAQGSAWDAGDAPARAASANTMATLLDRRRYLRNLVRDVNEVLTNESAPFEQTTPERA